MKPHTTEPLTPERLRELLHYSPDTGLFVRRVSRRGCAAGSVAGYTDKRGYVNVRIDYLLYYAHRLAWLYVIGTWPKNHIDHIDGNPANNRWGNLRNVTNSVNMQNLKRAPKSNALGVLGVCLNHKRYMANINVDGKHIYLGTYDSADEAHSAYLEAKRTLHAGCTI